MKHKLVGSMDEESVGIICLYNYMNLEKMFVVNIMSGPLDGFLPIIPAYNNMRIPCLLMTPYLCAGICSPPF